MKAVEGKLDKKGLADLFIMIDYKVWLNLKKIIDSIRIIWWNGLKNIW